MQAVRCSCHARLLLIFRCCSQRWCFPPRVQRSGELSMLTALLEAHVTAIMRWQVGAATGCIFWFFAIVNSSARNINRVPSNHFLAYVMAATSRYRHLDLSLHLPAGGCLDLGRPGVPNLRRLKVEAIQVRLLSQIRVHRISLCHGPHAKAGKGALRHEICHFHSSEEVYP